MKPFLLEPAPQAPTLHEAIAQPKNSKGKKVIVHTYPKNSPVRLEIVHQHEWEVEYFETERV